MNMVSQRGLGIVLALSLGLNLLVIGSVAGFFATGRHLDSSAISDVGPGKPSRRGAGPPVLGAILGELDHETRRSILRQLRSENRSMGQGRTQIRQARQDLAQILMVDPFDQDQAAAVMDRFGASLAQRASVSHDVILSELAKLDAETRQKLAEALLRDRRKRNR